MRIFTRFAVLCLLSCVLSALAFSPALAYNYLYVEQDTGDPIGWEPGTTIEYQLDPGDAGLLTNEQKPRERL